MHLRGFGTLATIKGSESSRRSVVPGGGTSIWRRLCETYSPDAPLLVVGGADCQLGIKGARFDRPQDGAPTGWSA
jgi:hypothetical protein